MRDIIKLEKEFDKQRIEYTKEYFNKDLPIDATDEDILALYACKLFQARTKPFNEIVEKVHTLQLMHETMQSMNNEDAYMDWITDSWIPDEPMESDFYSCAEQGKQFKETVDCFNIILKQYIKEGIYKPNEEVKEFLISLDKNNERFFLS